MNSEFKKMPIRKNYIVLLLLAIFVLVNICWFLMVGPVAIWGDVMFQEESEIILDIFMLTLFPLFLGIFISAASLISSVIFKQRWWISVPVSVIFLVLPFLGYLLTWVVSWPVRLIYLPTPQDAERTKKFLNFSITPESESTDSDKQVTQIKKMKELCDSGIITEDEFSMYKQRILTEMSKEQNEKSLPRYFFIWQATVATMLGGFLAGSLAIALNYKRLQDKDQFRNALIFGFIGHVISIIFAVITTMIYVGLDPWLSIPIAAVYPIIIYLWFHEAQKGEIAQLIENKEARKESWGIVLGISLLSIGSSVILVIPIALIIALLTSY